MPAFEAFAAVGSLLPSPEVSSLKPVLSMIVPFQLGEHQRVANLPIVSALTALGSNRTDGGLLRVSTPNVTRNGLSIILHRT